MNLRKHNSKLRIVDDVYVRTSRLVKEVKSKNRIRLENIANPPITTAQEAYKLLDSLRRDSRVKDMFYIWRKEYFYVETIDDEDDDFLPHKRLWRLHEFLDMLIGKCPYSLRFDWSYDNDNARLGIFVDRHTIYEAAYGISMWALSDLADDPKGMHDKPMTRDLRDKLGELHREYLAILPLAWDKIVKDTRKALEPYGFSVRRAKRGKFDMYLYAKGYND